MTGPAGAQRGTSAAPGPPPPDQRSRRPAGAVRLGAVWGIPVYLSLSTLVIVVLIAYTYSGAVAAQVDGLSSGQSYAAAALFAVLLFVSVFLHELGHAAVGRKVGMRVRSITLFMLGGVTELDREAPDPGRAYLVGVAGPMVSLLLAGLGWVAVPLTADRSLTHAIVEQLALTNLLVAVFNFLPGIPLDGGQLLRAGVWKLTGDPLTATRVAAWAGRVVAVLAVLAALYVSLRTGTGTSSLLWTLIIAFFIWQGASQALRVSAVRSRLPRLQAGAMARPAIAVPPDLPLSEALRRLAESHARGIVVVSPRGEPESVVIEEAVASTPEQRRPWVTVAAVARSVAPGLLIPAGLTGEPLVEAIQASPASEYVVVDARGALVGVLSVTDVAAVLNSAQTR